MKKYCICLTLFVTLGYFSYCQNMNTFLTNLSQNKNVEKVHIGRFFMSLVNIGSHLQGMPGKLHTIEVYTLENCPASKINQYQKEIKALKDENGYSSLIQVRDGDDLVKIMVKNKKNKIRELIITSLDDTDLCVVRITGKIKMTDLDRFIKQYTTD